MEFAPAVSVITPFKPVTALLPPVVAADAVSVGMTVFPVGPLTSEILTLIESPFWPRKVCVNVVEAVDPFEIDDALEVAEMANVSDCVG